MKHTVNGHKIIFKALVGSQSYGTALPESDFDYKGVYLQDISDVLGFRYKEQIDVNKDEVYYEVQRFLQLLTSANPTMLELLFAPDECVEIASPEWNYIKQFRKLFLTKKCRDSFGGYAVAQIKKAKGLDKKMNWEKSKTERKDIMDFMYVYSDGKSLPVKKWLHQEGMAQEYCGLVGLDHQPGLYALYYDWSQQYASATNSPDYYHGKGYKGICGDGSDDVRLSSIPKGESAVTVLTFNKDAYSIHCKEYREYQSWLASRNEARYVDTASHGQRVDGKNLMHCKRLLDMAMEIASEGTLNVRRSNAPDLLKIRRGEVSLDKVIEDAERDLLLLDDLFAKSGLPDSVDKDLVHNILVKLRHDSLLSLSSFS